MVGAILVALQLYIEFRPQPMWTAKNEAELQKMMLSLELRLQESVPEKGEDLILFCKICAAKNQSKIPKD